MYASCQSEPLLLEKHQDERFCREGEVEDDYHVHRGDDDDGDDDDDFVHWGNGAVDDFI